MHWDSNVEVHLVRSEGEGVSRFPEISGCGGICCGRGRRKTQFLRSGQSATHPSRTDRAKDGASSVFVTRARSNAC